jgi:hypothetical protein
MGAPYYVQVLASQRAAGRAISTWTTAVSVLNVADIVQLPVNWLQIGSKFRIRVMGTLTTVGTTSGTVTFQVMMGSVVAWTSGAVQLTTTAEATGQTVIIEVVLRVTAVDQSSGVAACTLTGAGFVTSLVTQLGAGAAVPTVTDSINLVPATAPGNGTAFQSETVENVDFWVGFSVSGNVFLCDDYTLEQLQ